MASPQLDEEERRLLREYRLTTFPPRKNLKGVTPSPTAIRQTQTPPTTIASTIATIGAETTNNASTPLAATSPVTTTKTATTLSPTINAVATTTTNASSNAPDATATATTTTISTSASLESSPAFRSPLVNNNNNVTNNNAKNKVSLNGGGLHRHHKDNHHHHHHHHHNSNHKRHKSVTPTHELTADELIQMLELASKIGFLKLVPEQVAKDDLEQTHTKQNGQQRQQQHQQQQNNRPYYIFEKINYIRRLNQRRKARRKSKKARNGGT